MTLNCRCPARVRLHVSHRLCSRTSYAHLTRARERGGKTKAFTDCWRSNRKRGRPRRWSAAPQRGKIRFNPDNNRWARCTMLAFNNCQVNVKWVNVNGVSPHFWRLSYAHTIPWAARNGTKRDNGNGDVFVYDLADQVIAVKLNIANLDTTCGILTVAATLWAPH